MTEPALLPSHGRVFGPVSGRRVARLAGIYLLLAAVGTALVFGTRDEHWQAFGLGLVLPGGGFLIHADMASMGAWHLLAALSALGLFVLALVTWFATGNILAPPTVWLGAAIWAAAMNHGQAHPGAVIATYGVLGAVLLAFAAASVVRFALAQRQRRADNVFLSGPRVVFPEQEADDELSLDQLHRLRFAYDRALQPIEAFDGFEHLDPFQTAAIRYQINFLAYALAFSHARYTPALAGYGIDAQRNLILKQARPAVWSYWRLENLWGNLDPDPNPVGRDNIMYTGFVALQMALLRRTTGVTEFRDGRRFRLNDSLAFDEGDLQTRLLSEYRRSPFCLFPCEPNWIYPLCNTIGASALLAGGHWPEIEGGFRAGLDGEFLDAFGRFVPCRSSRTGLALPAVGGAMPLAMPCFFLNAVAPDMALRQWLLLRRRLFLGGRFRRDAFWPIDTGNYGFSRASAYTAAMLAAAELGDGEVYDACLAALDDECPSTDDRGVSHRNKASVWAHGVELMARAGGKNSFRDLMTGPDVPAGPHLDGLSYPEVLVAAAHVESGGLRVILYGDGVFDIAAIGLIPHTSYALHGAASGHVAADETGATRFTIGLKGRTVLRLTTE